MKKILIITNKFPFGKDETFLETELRILLKSELNVTIFSQNKDATIRKIDPSVNVVSRENNRASFLQLLRFSPVLFLELLRHFGSFLKFKVMIRAYMESLSLLNDLDKVTQEIDSNRDVLIYSYWHDNSTLAACLLRRKFPSISVVTRTHGADLYKERSAGSYLPFRTIVFKWIDRVFCVSKNGERYLKDNYPKFTEKFMTAYLGSLNNQQFQTMEENPKALLSCSHINPVKRLDLLINSLSQLGRACRWDHFGYGYDYNEKPIFDLVDQVLVESSIDYTFHGQIPNDQIVEKMRSGNFSFLINLSKSEGLPVTMMEAMSCGIPCIGTDVGGVSEIIHHGVNGFLLSPNPIIEEVHEVIHLCLDMDIDRLNEMRKNAFDTWASTFNAENNYSNFAQALIRTRE